MPPKKAAAAFEPTTIAGTTGRLCIEDKYGQKADKGEVEVRILKSAPLEYFLQIFRNDELLISQEIDTTLDFDFRVKASTGESRMSWLLMREDGSARLLEFRYTENASDFKFAISVALFEASFQQEFGSVIKDDDAEWAADGIAGTMNDDDQYVPNFDYEESAQKYTMNDDEDGGVTVVQNDEPSREARIAALKNKKQADPSDSEEEEEEEEQKKTLRSGGSGYKTPKKGQGVKDGALISSSRKGKVTNSLLESGTCLNRTYVARGTRLGVFGYTEDDTLDFLNTLDKIEDDDGDIIAPDVLQLHDADHKMLMMDNRDKTKIYNLDLETGTIIDTWQGKEGIAFNSIAPRSKYAQTTNEQTIVGQSENAIYTIDPRINQQNKVAEEVEYKTKVGLSALATNGSGQVAAGAKNGDIRLYSKVQKNYCKTLLPGLGHAITNVDITEDGSWMVATTDTYLMLIPLLVPSSGKTGFDARMGKDKPTPLKLTISPEDRLKYGIEQVHFTKARFNTGTMSNTQERWIATSTGPFIVTFDFEKIKSGGPRNSYKIKQSDDVIVRDVFRHNHQNEVVVAQSQDVYMNFLNEKAGKK